ncbi:hypothetical protein [Sneathiella limimaris]|uniref:hypothetical protein n=1 Tax=Sneathiella limimaris TaxID=1964213 RepID=UPI00146C7961|nr:hypothetical protein [Sneathiella limimaris]
MEYPIKDMKDIGIEDLGIEVDGEGSFAVQIKGYEHRFTAEEVVAEMSDQLEVRNSIKNALLRKAQKVILSGLKKGRLRLSEEELEDFDLNMLIWFADKALKGEHKSYLTK